MRVSQNGHRFGRRVLLAVAGAFAPGVFATRDALAAPLTRLSGRTVRGSLFYGHSNAGGGGDARPLLVTPSASNIMTFAGHRQISGKEPVDPKVLAGFGPVDDVAPYPPLPETAMGDALAALTVPDLFFLSTVWYGSQPITTFLPDTTSWADLMAVARRMVELVRASDGVPTVSAVVFIQGESGPSDRQEYARQLTALLDALGPALRAQTGQSKAPAVLLMQTNAGSISATTPSEVDLAEWDVAQRRPGETFLAGPMYQLPLKGNIHQTAEGRMMLGELLALVYRETVIQGGAFLPLHPVATRQDRDGVTVHFRRPAETAGLAWDTSWVAPSPQYGFALRDASGDLPITAVDILDADSIHIAWSRPPAGPALDLLYAQGQPAAAGWASGRGQLMAETPIASSFARQGYHVPDHIRHYCLRFKMRVS